MYVYIARVCWSLCSVHIYSLYGNCQDSPFIFKQHTTVLWCGNVAGERLEIVCPASIMLAQNCTISAPNRPFSSIYCRSPFTNDAIWHCLVCSNIVVCMQQYSKCMIHTDHVDYRPTNDWFLNNYLLNIAKCIRSSLVLSTIDTM